MKNWVGVCALVLGGCSGGTGEVSGTYGIITTNEFNGCNLPGFAIDRPSTPASLAFTQTGKAIVGTVTGEMSDAYFTPMLGSNVFSGSVDGDDVSLSRTGTTTFTQGQCAYVVKVTINGTAHDSALTGIVYYQTVTNGSPDCELIQNCMTGQNLDGTRAE